MNGLNKKKKVLLDDVKLKLQKEVRREKKTW